jgi:uncharacterized protein (TIGR02145 family)
MKLSGFSGSYKTVCVVLPTADQNIIFDFMNCTDADSNHYPVVKIDTLVWMAQNLNTTRYSNGDSLPNIITDSLWEDLDSGAYCNYNNNPDTSVIYGRLYNWFAVHDTCNICPEGWHVPTNDDWIHLTDYLGGELIAGGQLKENCFALWNYPNTGAANNTGFTAIPGGYRYGEGGTFSNLGNAGGWWSSTESGPNTGWYRNLFYNSNSVSRHSNNKTFGLSVRCIKD